MKIKKRKEKKFNFAVLGKGGREAALVRLLLKSKVVKNVFCVPGNADTAKRAINVPEISTIDIKAVVEFVKKHKIKYVIPGSEAWSAAGIANALKDICHVFGPSEAASILEASKVFTKNLCCRLGVPTAKYKAFYGTKAVRDYLDSLKGKKYIWPLVLKLDGLEEGKGAEVCKNRKAAERFLNKIDEGKTFKNKNNIIIVEECLRGREMSFFLMVAPDGSLLLMPTAQDYKRAHNKDKGHNTGGMGAYSPAIGFTPSLLKKIMDKIANPLLAEMFAMGMPFVGFFYVGLMICEGEEPYLIEINVRMGDPEAEVILPRLKSDFGKLIVLAFKKKGGFSKARVLWDSRKCVTTVIASKGYPGKYKKGFPITGIEEAEKIGAEVYLAGAAINEHGEVVTDGGRVGMASGKDFTYEGAKRISQRGASLIKFDGAFHRTDIADIAVKEERSMN